MEDTMGIFVGRSQARSARKTSIISTIVGNLLLVLIILLVTGCTPSVKTTSLDVRVTQPVNNVPAAISTGDVAPIPLTGNTPVATSTLAVTATSPVVTFALTFTATADAYVKQSEPGNNFGSRASLQVDGGSSADQSYLQFTVKDVSGVVQSALLRLYAGKNGSKDGPSISTANSEWSEKNMTWNQRPQSDEVVLDNKGEISPQSWVEYNVTPAITGNGLFAFVLTPDSDDAINFSSREGDHAPELVITYIPDVISDATPTPLSFAESVTMVGAGDISMCDNDYDEQTAQLVEAIPGTVFTTGDNAYMDGSASNFRDCYDPTWGQFKDRTKPVPGNHEYHTAEAAAYFEYFDNIPSYYAYDLGGWRIYALNSEIDVSKDSPQLGWLKADLAAHPTQCVLAYWHQPRWSTGTEHGDSLGKQALWQTLYEARAELVLNGHEHNYERFAPMNAEGQPDPLGLREIVVGTGGGPLYPFGPTRPTSEIRNNTTFGVLKLTLRPDGYDWQFIPVEGSTFTDSGSGECH
jgi:hypothetical protein